jgi:hypothetical protein
LISDRNYYRIKYTPGLPIITNRRCQRVVVAAII